MNKRTGRLMICEGLYIELYHRLPNRFHRLMMRLAFGWKFERGE